MNARDLGLRVGAMSSLGNMWWDLVDCNPCRSWFKCPLAVASDGVRYFVMSLGVRPGQVMR